MNAQPIWDELRDLGHRAADGIEVTPLWAKAIDRVWVAVRNRASGEEVEVREDDNPRDVFRHPCAYAAAPAPELFAAA